MQASFMGKVGAFKVYIVLIITIIHFRLFGILTFFLFFSQLLLVSHSECYETYNVRIVQHTAPLLN